MMAEGGGSPPRPAVQTVAPPANGEERTDSHGGVRASRDLTEGSIPGNLWYFAWPQMVEGVLNVVDQVADMVWAGRLGSRSLAGFGVAQTYVMLPMTGRMGFDTAMRAMVARAVGSRDIALANHIALQAFTLSGLFSIAMVMVGVFLTEPMMRLLGVSDEVVAAGADYMRVLFVGQGGIAFRMMTGAALQASGDAITPMKATMVTRLVHIGLSPCLVFGLLVFPEMGLAGAAAANVLAQFIGVAMNFHALFTGKSRLHLTFKGYNVDYPLLWQIVKIGAPASVTTAERVIAQLIITGIVARFGDIALAAYALTRRPELISGLATLGLGQAAGILVGQSIGAGKPQRARATVGWAIGFAIMFQVLIAASALSFAEAIISLFNQEPEFLATAVTWLRIQALGYAFLGIPFVLMQTYNTAGDTLFPMIVTLISLWAVEVPLSLTLPGFWDLGQYGIAWATNGGLAMRTSACGSYFFWGPWMKKNPLGSRRLGSGLP